MNFHSTPPPKVKPLALKLSLLWKIVSPSSSLTLNLRLDIEPAPTNQAEDQEIGKSE